MEVQEINFPDRLQHIFKEIQRFCQSSMRNAIDVELILETKGMGFEQINELFDLGVKKLRVGAQELNKMEEFGKGGVCFNESLNGIDYKFLSRIELWEDLKTVKEAEEINDVLIRNEVILKVLLKIDLENESKGFDSRKLFLEMKELVKFKNIKIIGITLCDDQFSEENFHKMKAIFDLLKAKYKGIEILVMGDLKTSRQAIQNGSHRLVLGLKDFM